MRTEIDIHSSNDGALAQRMINLVPSIAKLGLSILKINCVQSQLLSPEKKFNKVSKKFNREIATISEEKIVLTKYKVK